MRVAIVHDWLIVERPRVPGRMLTLYPEGDHSVA